MVRVFSKCHQGIWRFCINSSKIAKWVETDTKESLAFWTIQREVNVSPVMTWSWLSQDWGVVPLWKTTPQVIHYGFSYNVWHSLEELLFHYTIAFPVQLRCNVNWIVRWTLTKKIQKNSILKRLWGENGNNSINIKVSALKSLAFDGEPNFG